MKKKFIVILSTVVIVASAAAFNQSFAAESTENPASEGITTKNIQVAEQPIKQSNDLSYNVIDESKQVVNIPLNLHQQNISARSIGIGSDPIISQEYAQTVVNSDQTESAVVRYMTASGLPITIAQAENPYGLDTGIKEVKSWYDPSVTQETEINGHQAIIEDAVRKHVHILTEDKIYTVNSVDADNLDQLIEIAKLINVE